jgi:predicted nucleic acid-binding protein
MICLDTNYLIRGVAINTLEAADLTTWFRAGEVIVTAMPAWFEFLCGPVTDDQVSTMQSFLAGIIPFAEREAAQAARLFNAMQRKRSHRVDAMIAASAMVADARLATSNHVHFAPFVAHGLQLI